MTLKQFLPDWWAEEEHADEEEQLEALRAKAAAFFSQLGGPELSGG